MSVPRGLKCVRKNICRPSGTRDNFPLSPALKRWAKTFRPSGADSWANVALVSHCNFENRVLTHTLKSAREVKINALAARLKSCPDTRPSKASFQQPVKSCPDPNRSPRRAFRERATAKARNYQATVRRAKARRFHPDVSSSSEAVDCAVPAAALRSPGRGPYGQALPC